MDTTETTTNPSTGFDAVSADIHQYHADRQAWIEAGRPADPSYAHWARVLADAERREAEAADPSRRPWATPLVRFH